MKIIGITGTNGKTSTAHFIYQMLEGMGRKAAVCGTLGLFYDNKAFEIGLTTPANETLLFHIGEMERVGVEYLIMEVSSHALVQGRVKGLKFEVGVFTNLTRDHLDYHGTFENYKAAKRQILDMSKTMVFNTDDRVGEEFFHEYYKEETDNKEETTNRECLTIATHCDCADLAASRIETNLQGTEFLLNFLGTKTHIKVPIPGNFTAYNVMSAMAVLRLLGFSYDEIIAAVPELKPIKGRAQVLDLQTDFTVMIDFAHTPDALYNILTTIRDFFDGRIITLFGCGGERDRGKRKLMGEVVSQYSDYIYLTSDNPRNEDPMQIIADVIPSLCEGGKPYRIIADRELAITQAVKNALPGDLILLAGKGHETYQVIENEKLPFDEEKIVRKALIF